MGDDEVGVVIGLVSAMVDRGAELEELLKVLAHYVVDGGLATVQAAAERVHGRWAAGQTNLGDVALAFKHVLATGLFVAHG